MKQCRQSQSTWPELRGYHSLFKASRSVVIHLLLPDRSSNPSINPLNHSVILRIGRSLVQHRHRLPVQSHILALEPEEPNARDVVLPVAPVVLEEQRDRRSRVPVRAVQRDLENVPVRTCQGLRDVEFLRRIEVGGGREVEVGPVAEELDGFRGGGGGRGVDEEGVEFDLSCESVGCLVCSF